jgi:hypothetical protein
MNIEEHIAAGKFSYAADQFSEKYDRMWLKKGTCVRGPFIQLDMGENLFRSDAVDILRGLRHPISGHALSFANAFELPYFASHGWNGQDFVLALGSMFMGWVPALRGQTHLGDDRRELVLEVGTGPWLEAQFLCVGIPPSLS